jgi:hypothetical protein
MLGDSQRGMQEKGQSEIHWEGNDKKGSILNL